LADNPYVSGTIVCAVCGTVNVGVFARCIACGQALDRAVAAGSDDSDDIAGSEDVPISQEREVTGPVLSPKPPSSGSGRSRSKKAEEAMLELESASYRQTVVEMPGGHATAPVRDEHTGGVAPPPRRSKRSHRGVETGPAMITPTGAVGTRFVARLLLPEGDRRSVEVGKRPVVLGSGLDELGLAGDPRLASAEAELYVSEGRLFVEPAPNAANVYKRIDREIKLRDGDVVLIGDIAAMFVASGPPGAVDGARQVLGGSANAPCGRLVFLRRDGSPGPAHDLPAGKTVLGRTDGHLNFPNDSRLSRRHALFFASDQGVTLEDMESRNGTYMRVRERTELRPEDALRIGSAGLQIRAK
jgi:hypothetical protein